MKYIILLICLLVLQCKGNGEKEDKEPVCPRCVSQVATIELIDPITKHHVINTEIIIKNNKNRLDTLILKDSASFKPNGYVGRDTLVCILGEPGIYSFLIQTKGYKNIMLTDIVVKSAVDPRCKLAVTIHFVLNLQRINSNENKTEIKTIQDQYEVNCCGK